MISDLFLIVGGLLAVIAGVGLVRFDTTYARLHAAGKASPVAFLIASVGAGLQADTAGLAYLVIAVVAMVVTLPIGVHLLFRAVHRTSTNNHLVSNEVTRAEK